MVLLFDLYLTLVALCVCAMHKVYVSFVSFYSLINSASYHIFRRLFYRCMDRRIRVFLHWRLKRGALKPEPVSVLKTEFFSFGLSLVR